MRRKTVRTRLKIASWSRFCGQPKATLSSCFGNQFQFFKIKIKTQRIKKQDADDAVIGRWRSRGFNVISQRSNDFCCLIYANFLPIIQIEWTIWNWPSRMSVASCLPSFVLCSEGRQTSCDLEVSPDAFRRPPVGPSTTHFRPNWWQSTRAKIFCCAQSVHHTAAVAYLSQCRLLRPEGFRFYRISLAHWVRYNF